MLGLGQDIRHSLRSLLRSPGFTLVTILTLGVGIGATTAIFSAVHTVLLRELPYSGAEAIVTLRQTDTESGELAPGVSAANISDLARNATRLSYVAVAEPWSMDLTLPDRTETLRSWAVSHGFFQAIGGEALIGRTFISREYVDDGARVVVLSHRSWAGRFGGDRSLVGGTLTLNGEAHTVIGVLPPEFRFPDQAEAWIPRPPRPWDDASRSADFMRGVARLAPGATLAQAQAEVDRLGASLEESHPRSNAHMGFRLTPLREALLGNVRFALMILLGTVLAVLLMACANVTGLMLARGTQRVREYALRGALGASSGRLMQHVAVESLLLAGAGCALGILLTFAGVRAISALGPEHLPRIEELGVDRTVLAFALLMGAISALASGMAPALRFSRLDLRGGLSDGSKGSTGSRAQHALRRRLVVGEIAGAVVLLIGAGLLVRSFTVLTNRELGFDPSDRLALQLFAYGYESREARVLFLEEAIGEIEAIPGVEAVALTSNLPGANDGAVASIEIHAPFLVADQPLPHTGQEPTTSISMVSPGFFRLLDIPTVAGRGFLPSDNETSAPVVMVNETLARRFFPGRDPVGKELAVLFGRQSSGELAKDLSQGNTLEIVGVVRDVRPLGFESDPRPEIYLPMAQGGDWGSITLVIRTFGDPESFLVPATEAVWAANPAQSVWGATTLEELLADWLKARRFNLLLLVAFSGVALFLATVGIYGLVNFTVQQRVGEIGIRRALGGRASDIMALVLKEGFRLAATGIALGLVAALFLTRFLQSMLFAVQPTDPLTFASLATMVLVVAGTAALLPAFRATRVDPMESLRSE